MPKSTPELLLGGAAATLLTTGRYPLTQVFQVEEDLARGDRTFAAHVGPRGVFRTTLACFALGLVTALPAARAVFAPAETVVMAVALLLLIVALAVWARRFDPAAQIANHDRVLTIGIVTSGSFVALIVRHLWGRVP